MEKLVVKGGTPLIGEVEISGAKNSAVAIIPATLIVTGEVLLRNVPEISDIKKYYEVLEELGAKIERIDKNTVRINTENITKHIALSENVKKFRASYYLIGALLGRGNEAIVGMPGGCNLGARPIDQHIKGFEALGVDVKVEEGYISAKAEKVKGEHIFFDVVSVGATINVMLSAVMCDGVTILENCAKEPHIVDVANFLNTVGADIKGAGTDTIKITGVKKLKTQAEYTIVPDQIETGTFMIAAAVTKGDLVIKNCIPKHMESLTAKLREMGAIVKELGDKIEVKADKRLNKVHIKTMPYPGFPTDLQSQMGVAIAMAKGNGSITESIWDSRFAYTEQLNKMGAKIQVAGKRAIFSGVEKLKGAKVYATDLRAGASLIIAGCLAEGTTEIYNIEHIDRGYENIEEKFRKIGADIEREEE